MCTTGHISAAKPHGRTPSPSTGLIFWISPLWYFVSAIVTCVRTELRLSSWQPVQETRSPGMPDVTHDQSEAMAISDKVIIMRKGVIEQTGTAMEIYARPKNQFVAGFIGKANFVPPDEIHSVSGGRAEVTLLGRRMQIEASEECRSGEPCVVMIRPEDIKIAPEGEFRARIISKAYFGQYIRHYLDIGGQEIEQMDFTQSNAALQDGDEISVDLVTDSLRLLPGDDTKEI